MKATLPVALVATVLVIAADAVELAVAVIETAPELLMPLYATELTVTEPIVRFVLSTMVNEPIELPPPIVPIVAIVLDELAREKLPLPTKAMPLALSLTTPEMVRLPAPPKEAVALSKLTVPDTVDVLFKLELIMAPTAAPP